MTRNTPIIVAIALNLFAALMSPASKAADQGSELALTNDAIVRLDMTKGVWPPVESIGQLVARDETLRKRLGNPEAVRPLVLNRISRDIINEFKSEDPRTVLDQSIVVSYASSDEAARAVILLEADPDVVTVARGATGSYLVVNDPLYTNSFANPGTLDVAKFQWAGLRLNLDAAWLLQQGYGYVGLLDNGIETRGVAGAGVHPDLVFNYKPQFSRNFGFANNGTYNDGMGNPRRGGGVTTSTDLDENPYFANPIAAVSLDYRAGHGTHTAGILAAQTNNGVGTAGVCRYCSLALSRVSTWNSAFGLEPDSGFSSSGVSWSTNLGAQTINMSFRVVPAAFGCSSPTSCPALDAASLQDVMVVAANGNDPTKPIDFPANYPTVVAVAGAQWRGAGGTSFWTGAGTFGSAFGTETDIAGPSASILSTMYKEANWSVDASCGDNYPPGYASGYGTCTGTSMGAPNISGVVQLYRSTKPTAPIAEVKAALIASAIPCQDTDWAKCGPGVPNAERMVRAALGLGYAVNRTTPLFFFYAGSVSSSGGGSDPSSHFYSVFPQMGTAAILGTLLPKPVSGTSISYWSYGPQTPGYAAFPGLPIPCSGFSPPCTNRNPTALVSVMTSFVNPIGGGPDLLRLTRWSYKCASTPCSPSNNHVSFVYSTDVTENWPSQGYTRDGVEGYVFPPSMPQPAGTVKLCRKYDSARDDYVLFPGGAPNGTSCAATTDGYTGGNYQSLGALGDWIGWVYPAHAPQSLCKGGRTCGLIAALPTLLGDDD